MTTGMPKAGDRFRWSYLEDERRQEAVITGVHANIEQGSAPESEEYSASWIEAKPVEGASAHATINIVLGTDGQSYLEGREVTVEVIR